MIDHIEFTEISGANILQALIEDIQQERKANGDTLEKLADKAGVSPSIIGYALRQHTTPLLDRIAAMYRAYGYKNMKIAIYLD